MWKKYLLVVGLTLSPIVLSARQKPVIVVQVFTAGFRCHGLMTWKQMQAQSSLSLRSPLARFRRRRRSTFKSAEQGLRMLATEITAWHPETAGEASCRWFGLGS